jgi:membrane-associated phospholipid phosphatase
MKENRRWRTPPKLTWSDLLLTLLPAVFWLLAIYSRATLITPHCAQHPENCTTASLLSMDRPAVGLEVPGADALSFTTQGLSGVLAMGVPLLWHGGLLIARQISPLAAAIGAGTDLIIFAQTAVWNGLLTETSHLITQRGRPFVYTDPQRARDFANYTSFYSGHTSFAAASAIFLLLTLLGRGAPKWLLGFSAAMAYGLMSLTGLYRVLAGRHFPTDVLAGAIAGTLVASLIAYRHRSKSNGPALASPPS